MATLFSVAEARAFDKGQLSDAEAYTDAAITAKEVEIRQFLIAACRCDWFTTTHTNELAEGYGTSEVMLAWPLISAVTAVSYRAYGETTWTALTAGQLAECQYTDEGLLIWEGGSFPAGRNTVKATYTAGHATTPDPIKRAALRIAVMEMPASLAPWTADGYSAGDVSYSFGRGDGYNGQWSADPVVMSAIRMYDRHLPGVA